MKGVSFLLNDYLILYHLVRFILLFYEVLIQMSHTQNSLKDSHIWHLVLLTCAPDTIVITFITAVMMLPYNIEKRTQ